MRRATPRWLRTLASLLGLLVLLESSKVGAFAEWTEGELSAELRGSARVTTISAKELSEEAPEGFFADAAFLRLLAELGAGEWLRVEVHALEQVSGFLGTPFFDAVTARSGERNRSAALFWKQRNDTFTSASLELDRLNLRLTFPRVDLTIGRQPINLATSSLFTPNDFFAAFSAQTFYRLYKPGVDAARADIELGQFAFLSLIGVLGYEHGAAGEASDPATLEASSLLGRAVFGISAVELSLLGGKIGGEGVIGAGLQGELFEWLGIRGEGHVRLEDDPRVELSLGLEHRFESSLFLRAEQFYHGAGAPRPEEYLGAFFSPGFSELPYLGRHYTAAGASYELTPLLTGDVLLLLNWSDRSFLVSAYLVYSLLDEAEASLTASLPLGEGPDGLAPRSEFGLYPFSVAAELRWYF